MAARAQQEGLQQSPTEVRVLHALAAYWLPALCWVSHRERR